MVIFMEKAYKYRIYPNKKQQELIQKTFGCCRFIYNYYLDKQIKDYTSSKIVNYFYDNSKDMTQLKKEKEWLKEPDKSALQNTLKDLDFAFKRFFVKNNDFPRFKSKKKRYKSYTSSYVKTTNGGNIKYLDKYIQLPKLGLVKIKDKQVPKGRILNATVSQEPNGHYYVSLCCTDIEFQPLLKTNKNVGIDLGLVDFAILSDGFKIENPRFYEKSEKKLAKLQKELSRKTIGGSNWNKARIKVANLQKHIAEQRRDFLQKLTTEIVRKYDIICIEDLDVQSMKETDSKMRNKRVGDVSWSEFRRQLEYKCRWYGKELRVVDRYFPSSQICHVCGVVSGKKPTDIRVWKCDCGAVLDRDINAAINILNEGLRII